MISTQEARQDSAVLSATPFSCLVFYALITNYKAMNYKQKTRKQKGHTHTVLNNN